MEEFGAEQSDGDSPEVKTMVFDLDEDGTDALEQFGIVKQAV